MKKKSILLVLFLALVYGLGACSKEDLVKTDPVTSKATRNVVMEKVSFELMTGLEKEERGEGFRSLNYEIEDHLKTTLLQTHSVDVK